VLLLGAASGDPAALNYLASALGSDLRLGEAVTSLASDSAAQNWEIPARTTAAEGLRKRIERGLTVQFKRYMYNRLDQSLYEAMG